MAQIGIIDQKRIELVMTSYFTPRFCSNNVIIFYKSSRSCAVHVYVGNKRYSIVVTQIISIQNCAYQVDKTNQISKKMDLPEQQNKKGRRKFQLKKNIHLSKRGFTR